MADVEKRQHLLADLDTTFRGAETKSTLLDGLDRFGRQAYEIITSRRAREAFDISRESPSFAEPYGKTPFGMSCLLATRLIESGVRFVTISYGIIGAPGQKCLVRGDGTRDRTVGRGVVGLEVRLLPLGGKGRPVEFLAVTLLGPSVKAGQVRLTVSALLPLVRVAQPLPFKI